jgi:hypothetical protein
MEISDTLPAGVTFVAATGGTPVTPDPAPGSSGGTVTTRSRGSPRADPSS